MRRRLIAACAALVLLTAGTVVLLAYVQNADARALAGVRTTEVLVVADQPIPQGTPAEELSGLVRTEVLPVKAALEGRVTGLTDLTGQVTTVELLPGEQLLSSRFAAPDDLGPSGAVPVPDGLQEVSVLLEPQRAVGGRLRAGDTVGVVVSLAEGENGGRTHAVLHQVLVTEVQGAPAPVEPAAGENPETASAGTPAPTQSLMVTLAVTAPQAEAVVFGVEHGTLWLSLEPAEADTSGTAVVDGSTIYGKSVR